MISSDEITRIGTFAKPHGISGEITALLSPGIDPGKLRCIVVDCEGLYVPFFIGQWRRKSAESFLLTLDDVNEKEIKSFSNSPIFALRSDLKAMGAEEAAGDSEEEGFYASDIVGFSVSDADSGPVGTVADFDDRTENLLILVERPDGTRIWLPLADDLIEEFDPDRQTLTLALPDGLLGDTDEQPDGDPPEESSF